jgi:hypothetical protein
VHVQAMHQVMVLVRPGWAVRVDPPARCCLLAAAAVRRPCAARLRPRPAPHAALGAVAGRERSRVCARGGGRALRGN